MAGGKFGVSDISLEVVVTAAISPTFGSGSLFLLDLVEFVPMCRIRSPS
jgi:hypothetical protein